VDHFKLKLESVPISINEAYRGRRFSTPKLLAYKQNVLNFIHYKRIDTSGIKILKNKKLCLMILINSNMWMTLKKTIKKNDVTNRIKTLEDAVFEALGIDDSQVWSCLVFKGETLKTNETVVHIETNESFFKRHPNILDILKS
jgi:Holliday junction resolvase RusA-like endonuclease